MEFIDLAGIMKNKAINVEIIRSDRKTLSIEIKDDLRVIARVPKNISKAEVKRFVDEKSDWIYEKSELMKKRAAFAGKESEPKLSAFEIKELARKALEVIPERVAYFAPIIGVHHAGITIRNQITRWGSCSAKGKLNFNCLLMLAPPEITDYVVVHELCHLHELNHSKEFWAHVERILPDYKKSKMWLKENGGVIIGRMKQ